LRVVAELLAALHDSYRLGGEYGRQSDLYSEKCADICRDCVDGADGADGADGVLRVVSCDDWITVLC
jgi:hypothetical protein